MILHYYYFLSESSSVNETRMKRGEIPPGPNSELIYVINTVGLRVTTAVGQLPGGPKSSNSHSNK